MEQQERSKMLGTMPMARCAGRGSRGEARAATGPCLSQACMPFRWRMGTKRKQCDERQA